ncbi:DUF6966 domain-containing protein [Rahnella woolbedingensis]|uniref:DUF6966 domain-containing protein n=1 Tax=Rahnella woolbedingensis TaxID=1510574 RepID=A0A419N1Y1_9GAMM|nr:hypothetical protein [Rahnella woolbedingensis]RJT32660.1 hypothetical protein D6C13_24425 [Rahnella woolbedingensis]
MRKKIKELLAQITSLLLDNDQKKWAEQFDYFYQKLDIDYDNTLMEIKRTFGGAGSFNDVVLHKDGKMLIRENRELSVLQDQLYDALKKEIISH